MVKSTEKHTHRPRLQEDAIGSWTNVTSLAKYFGFQGVVRATRCLSSARCLSSRRCLCSVAASILPSFRELVTCCQRCLRDGEGAQVTRVRTLLLHLTAWLDNSTVRGRLMPGSPCHFCKSRSLWTITLLGQSDLLSSQYFAMQVNFLNSFCSGSWLFTTWAFFSSKRMDLF